MLVRRGRFIGAALAASNCGDFTFSAFPNGPRLYLLGIVDDGRDETGEKLSGVYSENAGDDAFELDAEDDTETTEGG